MRSMFETILTDNKIDVDGVMANTLARLGMYEPFFEHVDKVRGNAIALMGIWDDGPYTSGLRSHPGFQTFARRAGMVAFWNEYGWPDKCTPIPENNEIGSGFTCS